MFAQLGNIKFDLITYFDGLSSTSAYNFAQHERINNKPILQFLGGNLEELNIKLNFHSNFCKPENEIKRLKEAAKEGKTLRFIKGNGDYIGAFVIAEISEEIIQTSNEGGLISVQAEVKLLEYAGKMPDENKAKKGFKKRK